MKIDTIAFDADDTLWENEHLYRNAQKSYQQIMLPWGDPDEIQKALYKIEIDNLSLYGYGIKAFTLSLIEAAIKISRQAIKAEQIEQILDIGRTMLQAEIHLRPHVLETLQRLDGDYQLLIITKGDLLDQTAKVERSGLAAFFEHVEVLNHKTKAEYAAILTKYAIPAEKFLMIGNALRSDILPVLALGGQAVYIPGNTTWEHEHVSDFDKSTRGFYELTHLGQLPDLLQHK